MELWKSWRKADDGGFSLKSLTRSDEGMNVWFKPIISTANNFPPYAPPWYYLLFFLWGFSPVDNNPMYVHSQSLESGSQLGFFTLKFSSLSLLTLSFRHILYTHQAERRSYCRYWSPSIATDCFWNSENDSWWYVQTYNEFKASIPSIIFESARFTKNTFPECQTLK